MAPQSVCSRGFDSVSAAILEGAEFSQTQVFRSESCPYVKIKTHDNLYASRYGQIARPAASRPINGGSVTSRKMGDNNAAAVDRTSRSDDSRSRSDDHRRLFTETLTTQSRELKKTRRSSSHTGKKPRYAHACQRCDWSFRVFSKLKRHERVHTGEKPFCCQLCGKSFGQFSTLKLHLLIHSGERPFVCRQCHKGFTDLSNLVRHERVHSGEKPFVCKCCQKSFNQVGNLSVHLRIHTAEIPFVCIPCDRTFASKRALSSHQRHVHTVGTTLA